MTSAVSSQLSAISFLRGAGARRLVADSRRIQAGDAFAAYPGEEADGRRFIAQAIAAGACCILWERDGFEWDAAWTVPNLGINDLRKHIGAIASAFNGEPSRRLWMIGITGTNGKTSCAHWLASALASLGRKTALVGTLGNGFPGALSPSANTTPDAVTVHALLKEYEEQGASAVAMEVSSHGLAQGRVNGVHFDVALLTNLSRDHLDYHGDMASYAAAKATLFDWPGLQYAILNLDDPFGAELAAKLGCSGVKVVGYGFHGEAQGCQIAIKGRDLQMSADGLHFEVATPWGKANIASAMLGRFNASNLLGVLAALLVSGATLERAVAALDRIQPVPGRLQQFGGGDKPLVVVDYAHTPDALEKVLQALREIVGTQGGLSCVFGCGGNRDKGKRPLMGAVVSALADHATVTSDNPRHEEPRAIIDEIVAGMGANFHVEEDRAAAIDQAIRQAKRGDIVLIAGKGHEDYQEINSVKLPFSDAEVAQRAFAGVPAMLNLSQAATALAAQMQGRDVTFTGVTTDSRAINSGDLFVALRGERFDAHDFVAQAIAQGAVAALVARSEAEKRADAWKDLPLIVVDDTRLALGKLAAFWRSRLHLKLVAVTGSNGKTTVKEMLAAILREAAGEEAVLATQGNLNNDIGMPLTLLKLRAQHKFAVIEMGMNHPGEIAYLSDIARPDVAVINNAGAAHLAGLGSVEQVARAKGEIFSGLATDGVAVINADDAFAPLWKELAHGHAVIEFGLEHAAQVSATCRLAPLSSELTLTTKTGEFEATLQVPGLHNVRNALAATAAATALGVDTATIAAGLYKFGGVKGRLQRKPGLHGATLIDDSYNANPASVKAAIAVLASMPGRKILVLGDMGELGPDACTMHRELGAAAKQAGVDILFAHGDLCREAAAEFGKNAWFFERIEELLADLENLLAPDVTVLVKGSRFMQMERVVKSFEVRSEE